MVATRGTIRMVATRGTVRTAATQGTILTAATLGISRRTAPLGISRRAATHGSSRRAATRGTGSVHRLGARVLRVHKATGVGEVTLTHRPVGLRSMAALRTTLRATLRAPRLRVRPARPSSRAGAGAAAISSTLHANALATAEGTTTNLGTAGPRPVRNRGEDSRSGSSVSPRQPCEYHYMMVRVFSIRYPSSGWKYR